MEISKVQRRRLHISSPPLPDEGGIIRSVAGDLFQLLNGPTFRFLSYIEFEPSAKRSRGNHYHKAKVETLIVVCGRLRAYFFDLDTSQKCELELVRGDIVTVQTHCAHAYYPLEFSQVIEIAPDPVDISDTYPWEIALIHEGTRDQK